MNTQQQEIEPIDGLAVEEIVAPTINEWIDAYEEYPVTTMVSAELTLNLFHWVQNELDQAAWATSARAEWRRDLLRLELAVATHYTNAAHSCVTEGNACLFGEEPIHITLHQVADNMVPSHAFQQRMRTLAQQMARRFRAVPIAPKSHVSVAIAEALNRNMANVNESNKAVKKLGRTVYGGER